MAVGSHRGTGNLPVEASSFIGRTRELDGVRRLLSDARLVTLTGIGGAGKTRLALRVADTVRRGFGDGVWFVDLTQVRELGLLTQEAQNPDSLGYLVMAALGLRQQDAESSVQQLTDYLAGRQTLLVLDNCEHVLPACAMLVAALLRACPNLRVVATSREPLTVPGETIFRMPPLPTPDPSQRPSLAELARYESVALFLARAQAAAPGFGLTAHNQDAVAELSHRLDGLPLAIELAAARVRVLTPEQILHRLTNRFALLSRGRRNAPERQQTLRACVEWSFELCSKPERLLWTRLTVFAGGCELDAIEQVCADEILPASDLLDLVAGLVDKSILVRDDSNGEAARYRMLETLRDFGQQQFVAAGEEDALRRRHRDWCQRLTDRASAEWFSDRQVYWLKRLACEHANLRAAVEHCLTEPDQAAAALRLAMALPASFWMMRGVLGELRRWLERALTYPGEPSAPRARALTSASNLALMRGDVDVGDRLLKQAQDIAERLGTPAELANVAYFRGVTAMFRNDLPAAVDFYERALTLLSAVPRPDLELRLGVLVCLGMIAGMTGDHPRADACYREMLALTEPCGEIYYRALALWLASLTARRQGQLAQATAQARESLRLRLTQGIHDRYSLAGNLEALAWIAADQDEHHRAATLLGAADTLWHDLGTLIAAHQHMVGDHDACQRQAHAALGDAAFAAAFRDGQALPIDEALAYALDERPQTTPAPATDHSIPLTRRERQIADLLTQGLSTKEIAKRLVISPRTVESHVAHVMAKLDCTNRAQIAAWVTARAAAPAEPHS